MDIINNENQYKGIRSYIVIKLNKKDGINCKVIIEWEDII